MKDKPVGVFQDHENLIDDEEVSSLGHRLSLGHRALVTMRS